VVLYEGLTGVCAFAGNSLYDLLLKKVQGEFAPLRTLKPELPEELCAVIERAMAADRDQRYPNVRAFANALLPFARERTRAMYGAMFNVKTGDELTPQAVEAAAAMRADSTLRSSVRDLPAVASRAPNVRRYGVPAIVALLGIAVAIAIGLSQRPPEAASPAAAAGTLPPPAQIEPIAPRPAAQELFTVHVIAKQPTARIALDGEAAGIGTLTRQLPKDGTPHTLEISAEGFQPKRITFTDAPPDPSALELVALAPPPPADAAPAQPAVEDPRPRKAAPTSRKPKSPAAASPQATGADDPAREPAPRRNVGSNDAPVLY